MAGKRFKSRDEFSVDEELAYRRDGTIPERPSADEEQALRAAGFDPESHRPLEEVEEEKHRRLMREEEIEFAESMSVEDWAERKRGANRL